MSADAPASVIDRAARSQRPRSWVCPSSDPCGRGLHLSDGTGKLDRLHRTAVPRQDATRTAGRDIPDGRRLVGTRMPAGPAGSTRDLRLGIVPALIVTPDAVRPSHTPGRDLVVAANDPPGRDPPRVSPRRRTRTGLAARPWPRSTPAQPVTIPGARSVSVASKTHRCQSACSASTTVSRPWPLHTRAFSSDGPDSYERPRRRNATRSRCRRVR